MGVNQSNSFSIMFCILQLNFVFVVLLVIIFVSVYLPQLLITYFNKYGYLLMMRGTVEQGNRSKENIRYSWQSNILFHHTIKSTFVRLDVRVNNRPNLEVKSVGKKRALGARVVGRLYFSIQSLIKKRHGGDREGEQAMMGLANRVMGYI